MMLYLGFIILLGGILTTLLWPVRHEQQFCVKVVAFFFITTFALYGLAGSPQVIPLLDERQEKIDSLSASMEKNSDLVKNDPKNLNAWVALSQDFLEAGQWEAAVNALKQAVLLSDGDPRLILAYAKAMVLVDNGKVNDAAKKSLEMVLLREPKNPEARYYLAVRQLQEGKTKQAMQSMKALYQSLPADSPLKAMIDQQIGKNN